MSTADLTPVPEQDPPSMEQAFYAIDYLAGKTTAMTPAEVLEAIRGVLADYHGQGGGS